MRLAGCLILDCRGMDFRLTCVYPAFDGDPVFGGNDATQLRAGVRWEPHFRSIIKFQSVYIAVAIAVNRFDDAGDR